MNFDKVLINQMKVCSSCSDTEGVLQPLRSGCVLSWYVNHYRSQHDVLELESTAGLLHLSRDNGSG